ncbi:MAG: hypothetical protein NT049_09565, partial [Planctomycetota bacterium]|nr:hypothetical protein [Planctomycetota bacterium]
AYDLQRLVLDKRFPADAPFATLRPRYTQAPDASQVLLAVGPGDAVPAIGVIMTYASDWLRPYENFPTARPLPAAAPAAAAKGERDGVAIDFPLAEGKRRWALVMAPKGRLDSKAEVQALIRRAADLPLDRVLGDWVLSWQRGKVDPAPHLLTTWDRLRTLRDELAAGKETPATRLLELSMAGDLPGDRRLAELLSGRRETKPEADTPAGQEPDAAGVLSAAPLLEECYQSPDLAPSAWPRGLPHAMIEADLAAAGRTPEAGALSTTADATLALLAYVFTDPNYQPGAAGGWDPGGSPDDLYVIPLYAAAMLPDHPHAARWAAAALAAMRDDFRRAAGPPVKPAALAQVLARMRSAQNGRLEDPFRWSEVRPALEFLMSLHSPPDPRLGRRDLAPFAAASSSADRKVVGASAQGAAPAPSAAAAWNDDLGAVFGLAAAGLREADPKLAAQSLALYRDYCGSGSGSDFIADLAAAEVSHAAALDPALFASREWPGFGAVLRSRFGSDRETMAAFRCGLSRGPGEMAFHFYGAGMPVALAWHAAPPLRIEEESHYNRMSVGEQENMDAPAELLALASTPAADVAVGQSQATVLRKLPRFPHEIAGAAAYPRRTLASETRWRRYLALVKHAAGGPLEDYLVIRDELTSTEPEALNLWVLARSVRQEGRCFYFDGQLAADLVAFVASPDVDRIRVEQWSWPRQDESSMIPAGFGTSSEE